MENPYCIQRGKFENRKEKQGIDSLLIFDYMGSSEFEFGALPSSLKRVRANLDNYVQFQYSFTKYPSKVVTVFCTKEQQEFIGDILEKLVLRQILLKEYCDVNEYVNPNKDFKRFNTNDFWWDIDQDWFFWKFNPEFESKFKIALDAK
jgi:hypothetical protein